MVTGQRTPTRVDDNLLLEGLTPHTKSRGRSLSESEACFQRDAHEEEDELLVLLGAGPVVELSRSSANQLMRSESSTGMGDSETQVGTCTAACSETLESAIVVEWRVGDRDRVVYVVENKVDVVELHIDAVRLARS